MQEPDWNLHGPETAIYVGDCRKLLQQMPTGKADLIFADPPFNQGVRYDRWHDSMPRRKYLDFTYGWLDECVRVLADQGALWINIPDHTAAEIVVHLKGRGLEMVNWCIWHFRFGQCRRSSFIVSKTHVLYFAKDRRSRTWNPDAILVPSDRATAYNDRRTQQTTRPGRRVPLDVWYGPYLGRVQGNNLERRPTHRNQIPEAYMQRIILASTNEGDLILDPFLGSGTTCTVARALNRRSIGIEIDPAYAESAYERAIGGPVRVGVPQPSHLPASPRLCHSWPCPLCGIDGTVRDPTS